MRFVFVPRNEIEEPLPKLADGVHHAKAGKSRAAFGYKITVTCHLIDGTIGGVIVFKRFAHPPEQTVIAIFRYSDATMYGGGTQVEQKTVWLKNAMSFEEGMDHALVRDSSQRPCEHHGIERFVRVPESLSLPDFEAHSFSKPLRQSLASLRDRFRLRVIRLDDRAELCKSGGESTVAATDLEDMFATPVGHVLEGTYFVLFRVDTEGHRS